MLFSSFPLLFLAASLCLSLVSCRDGKKEDTNVIELNFGHFPNVTTFSQWTAGLPILLKNSTILQPAKSGL